MKLVDTNVFIRYLIGDDPAKHQQSRALFERIRTGQEDAFTTEIIVHEICFYNFDRKLDNLPGSGRLQP